MHPVAPADRPTRDLVLPPTPVLYLAIPAQNEVATIGVLLWRLRTVLAEFPREYEVVVYDDASTDETAAVASQYEHAMPVTVLRGARPVGYAGAVDALVRYVAGHTRYPRRDAMLLLQGDFTDPPGIVPEFARRFEGGADLVIGERTAVVDAPVPVRRLFTAASWALRPFVRVNGLRDLTGSMRLVRISALRDLLRAVGDQPVCSGDSWTANADLLLQLVPHARRIESVPVEPTYGVRTRETRRVTVRDALAALRWGWRARGRRPHPMSAAESGSEPTRGSRNTPAPARRDEPELTVDRLRERTRDNARENTRDRGRERNRDRDRRTESAGATSSQRDGKPERDRSTTNRTSERPVERGTERLERPSDRAGRRAEGTESARPPRPDSERSRARGPADRAERSDRTGRRGRGAVDDSALGAVLDDPFAGPVSRDRTTGPAVGRVPSDEARERTARPETPRAFAESNNDTLRRASEGDASPGGESREDERVEGRVADMRSVDEEALNRDGPGSERLAEDDDANRDAGDDGTAERDPAVRKRRRNRRSRRRKSGTRDGAEASNDVEGVEDADGAADGSDVPSPATHRVGSHDRTDDPSVDDTDDEDEQDARESRASRARKRRRGRKKRGDREARPGDADREASGSDTVADDRSDGRADEGSSGDRRSDDDSRGDDDSEGGTDDDARREARARRRGRRGRRGGARRARSRPRDGGDGADASGADGSSSGGGNDSPASGGAPE